MSETEQRETELVTGIIEGITQKRADTWQVGVKPDGSQYTKNLWTKSTSLVEALQAKLGQHGAFVCSASYWENKSGQQVRSLWINEVADEERLDDLHISAKRDPESTKATGSEGMSKEEWARKDSAIHKMACIKTAAAVLTHTLPADPSTEDLNKFAGRVADLSSRFHTWVLAERDDPAGDNIPF